MSRPFNVLLIEDDRTVQYAIVEGLSDAGHIVSVAGSLRQALNVLMNYHQLDVILLDLRLGADRGEDIFLNLQACGIPCPPVIIVSAQPEREIERVQNLINAAAALRKPALIEDICATMESAVG